MAIERSDVCVIMIDATEGVTEQDTKVAGLAHEAGRACIIAVNKWDAVEKTIRQCRSSAKSLTQILRLCHMRQRYLFLQNRYAYRQAV